MVVQGVGYCALLRDQNQDIWQKIDEHPFLAGLRDGTLPDRKLKFYFTQNVQYIDTGIQGWAIAAAKAPDQETRDLCLDIAQVANTEMKKQVTFVADLPGGAVPTEISPTCHGYTRHQLTEVHQGGAVDFLVAHLPCPWTYEVIGHRLAPVVQRPVHAQWMAFYGSDEHTVLVERMLAIVDRLTGDSGEAHRRHMARAFRTSMRYEWMFWEMAYREETWPV
jgi:thiaminase/transcriptional activator TenA